MSLRPKKVTSIFYFYHLTWDTEEVHHQAWTPATALPEEAA